VIDMAYIYNEIEFNKNISTIMSLLEDIKYFADDEIKEIVSEIENIVEDIDNNFDTTDGLFETLDDALRTMLDAYRRDM